jgi:hypothetical protein
VRVFAASALAYCCSEYCEPVHAWAQKELLRAPSGPVTSLSSTHRCWLHRRFLHRRSMRPVSGQVLARRRRRAGWASDQRLVEERPSVACYTSAAVGVVAAVGGVVLAGAPAVHSEQGPALAASALAAAAPADQLQHAYAAAFESARAAPASSPASRRVWSQPPAPLPGPPCVLPRTPGVSPSSDFAARHRAFERQRTRTRTAGGLRDNMVGAYLMQALRTVSIRLCYSLCPHNVPGILFLCLRRSFVVG